MYSMFEINSKAILARDAVNFVLKDLGLSVDRIFLCGSYARGKANEYSDIDYLVIVQGKEGSRPLTLPNWKQMMLIKQTIDNTRIHVIYGASIDAQKSLCQRDPVKYAYTEIQI